MFSDPGGRYKRAVSMRARGGGGRWATSGGGVNNMGMVST